MGVEGFSCRLVKGVGLQGFEYRWGEVWSLRLLSLGVGVWISV